VDLGGERTLWLFDDSFVATSPANLRTESEMVHNTVAIMEGRNPSTATMHFFWRTDATNSFEFGDLFTEAGAHDLYWPRFVRLQK